MVAPARRAFPPERSAPVRRMVPAQAAPVRRMVPEAAPHRRKVPPARPLFDPPEWHESVYQRWAAAYLRRNMWRALPQEDLDDLLQDAYFKYARCVQLYVYEKASCKGVKHLMCIFKQAVNNMLTDRSRKKQRKPGAYYFEQVDPDTHADYTMAAVEEWATF